VLVDLYRVARRSALRADEIVDALMEALPREDEAGTMNRTKSLFGRDG
jgi:hypothetical protein